MCFFHPLFNRVEGGKDPYNPEYYHPFVVTSDVVGGFERLTDDQKKEVRILAGKK